MKSITRKRQNAYVGEVRAPGKLWAPLPNMSIAKSRPRFFHVPTNPQNIQAFFLKLQQQVPIHPPLPHCCSKGRNSTASATAT
jgi:hypothetical protein